MSLGDKIGLFCRTILVPVTRTTLAGRDQTCVDAGHNLRTVLYKRPRDLAPSEFALIYARAAGKPRVVSQVFVLSQILAFGAIGFLAYIGFARMSTISVVLVTIAMTWGIYVFIKDLRATDIPDLIEAAKVRDAWLSAQRCPSCGYPLSSRTDSASPLSKCTECGALWRLSLPSPPSALSAPPRETPPPPPG